MQLTHRRLNRATLERQMLLGRRTADPGNAVRDLVALQAQEPSTPYLALWSRVAGFDPAALDAAFAAGDVVRSPSLRLTLHAAHADDWPAWYRATVARLRASRVGDRRFLGSGLTAEAADALLPDLLEHLRVPRTEGEIKDVLRERLGPRAGAAWFALRRYAPLLRAPTGGPWSFDETSFVAAPAAADPPSPERAVRELVLRHLRAFGPATVQDVARFTMLRVPDVRAAVTVLEGAVEPLPGPDGGTLLDVAGAQLPDGDVPAPARLLPMWDGVLLAHEDRGRVLPPAYRPLVIRRNGDVLATLLVDGHVAGVWRPVPGGIEATAFRPLDGATWDELAAEAVALHAVLAARDPALYGRYGHWWRKGLPAADVRLLPG